MLVEDQEAVRGSWTVPWRRLGRWFSSWPELLIFAFVLLCLLDGLKAHVHPRVHWIGFGIVSLAGARTWVRLRPRNYLVWLPAAVALVLAIVVVGTRSGQLGYDLAQAAKLAVLVGAGAGLFVSYPRYARVAFGAFVVAVCLNVALLLCGLLGARSVAWEMATGRWGTILSPPGTLARLGMATWLYAGYMALIGRRWWGWGLLLASWGVVFVEGSRTQFLLAAVAGAALVWVAWVEPGRAKVPRLLLAIVLLIATIMSFMWSPRPEIKDARESGVPGPVAVTFDSVRIEMLKAGLRAVAGHPFLGTGMGTTRVETATWPMVIHNAYLQSWADIGNLGLVAYTWLMLGWVFWLARAWGGIRRSTSISARSLYYNAVFMLSAAALAGLFHAFSTEWSEWILFLVPYALFWEAVHHRPKEPCRDD